MDNVAATARRSLALQGRWPGPTSAGGAPPELAQLGGNDGPFARDDYTLGWTTWQVVDSTQAPPEPAPPPTPGDPPRDTGPRMMPVSRTVGAVSLRSGDEDLLSELLRHFGSGASFVLDSTWVLVLPERAETAGRTGLPGA